MRLGCAIWSRTRSPGYSSCSTFLERPRSVRNSSFISFSSVGQTRTRRCPSAWCLRAEESAFQDSGASARTLVANSTPSANMTSGRSNRLRLAAAAARSASRALRRMECAAEASSLSSGSIWRWASVASISARRARSGVSPLSLTSACAAHGQSGQFVVGTLTKHSAQLRGAALGLQAQEAARELVVLLQ